jgi:hypothetical protein
MANQFQPGPASENWKPARREIVLAKLISFDIDGTLEAGDPPGCVTMELVRQARELGYIIGSCSDRTISNQQRIWKDHAIPVEFTVLKHQLDLVKAQFDAETYFHIGDTDLDRQAARRAGFEYLLPAASLERLWMPF